MWTWCYMVCWSSIICQLVTHVGHLWTVICYVWCVNCISILRSVEEKKILFQGLAGATAMTTHCANDCRVILGSATTLSHRSRWHDKAVMLGVVARWGGTPRQNQTRYEGSLASQCHAILTGAMLPGHRGWCDTVTLVSHRTKFGFV
jgi:hypothetical protein